MLDCGRDPDRVKNAEADTYGLSMILGISAALSLIVRSTAICPPRYGFVTKPVCVDKLSIRLLDNHYTTSSVE